MSSIKILLAVESNQLITYWRQKKLKSNPVSKGTIMGNNRAPNRELLDRILYAEDDMDIQELVSLALTMIGNFTLKICNSGLEAVNEVEAFDPQLLLLDVMMPFLDGPGALKKIRKMEAFKEIPVIFLTAKVQGPEVRAYLRMPDVAVISKPFDPLTLADQITEFWANLDN
ncbi:MAG: two-component system OmpR family response regulator [Arenicella sp.]|jgi:two-component system OmpR family response regulator